jgi:hypothetical protein
MALPHVYHSGGDVVLEGHGRLTEDEFFNLLEAVVEEIDAAYRADDHATLSAKLDQAVEMVAADKAAMRWADAAGARS